MSINKKAKSWKTQTGEIKIEKLQKLEKIKKLNKNDCHKKQIKNVLDNASTELTNLNYVISSIAILCDILCEKCEYVNYFTKMQILRENTNILQNAGTMQILRGITTRILYFSSRGNDAKIQANRLLRVYRAELLVRLDQFSYTHS